MKVIQRNHIDIIFVKMSSTSDASTITSLTEAIINKLKYIYNDANSKILNELIKISDAFKTQKNDTGGKVDIKQTEEVEQNISEAMSTQSCDLFKKIKMLFSTLESLIKILIIRVDDPRYQNAIDEKTAFPKTVDGLIVIVGCYNDAFSKEISEELFNIVDCDAFSEMRTISGIDYNMIPFVATDRINNELLQVDYLKFSGLVKNFACNVLNINTDFEKGSIFEYDQNSLDV
jgi:hypothetical protein